jgi:hypothetical protein
MTHYLVVAALALGAAAGWKVQGWRWDADKAKQLEATARERMRAEKNIETASAGHEADKRGIRTRFITITKEVDRVVQSPFYAAGQPLCLDDDGLRQLRAAISPAAAASQPERAVPGAAAAPVR